MSPSETTPETTPETAPKPAAKSEAKPKGRPKAYDRDTALKAMRAVFWTNGFAAASLDDLSAATGMNRPSLYNAFGDKTGIFRAVLDDYVNEVRPLYRAALEAELPLRQGLMAVYDAAFAIYRRAQTAGVETQNLGCFMIAAALTDSKRDPDVAAMILGALKEMEQGFGWRLKRAQAAGELRPDADIKALAKMASSAHTTISVRMRAGESIADIRRFLEEMIEIICKPG